jgi:hypothetical protein
MLVTDLGTVQNQTDLSETIELGFQPFSGNAFIPIPDPDGGIVQEPAQATSEANQFGLAWDLHRNVAQTNRATLMNSDDQPYKVAYLGNPLTRSHFTNPVKPGIIEAVDRHEFAPFCKMFRSNDFTGVLVSINFHFVKVSGD